MLFLKAKMLSPPIYVSSGKFISKEGWIHPKRFLDTFVLLLGINNEVYIQQENDRFILKPNSSLLLIPFKTHYGYELSKINTTYFWCHFKLQDHWEIVDIIDIENEIQSNRNTLFLPIYSECNNSERVLLQFKSLLDWSNSEKVFQQNTDYILSCLIYEIAEQGIQKIRTSNNCNEKSNFSMILEWIRINLKQKITITDIANQFNYNEIYLSKLFKKKLNMSFCQYLLSMRLKKAKEMLLTTNDTIKEIAYKCGFEDEKYFMKLFKKYENVTPSQYRNVYPFIHMNDH